MSTRQQDVLSKGLSSGALTQYSQKLPHEEEVFEEERVERLRLLIKGGGDPQSSPVNSLLTPNSESEIDPWIIVSHSLSSPFVSVPPLREKASPVMFLYPSFAPEAAKISKLGKRRLGGSGVQDVDFIAKSSHLIGIEQVEQGLVKNHAADLEADSKITGEKLTIAKKGAKLAEEGSAREQTEIEEPQPSIQYLSEQQDSEALLASLPDFHVPALGAQQEEETPSSHKEELPQEKVVVQGDILQYHQPPGGPLIGIELGAINEHDEPQGLPVLPDVVQPPVQLPLAANLPGGGQQGAEGLPSNPLILSQFQLQQEKARVSTQAEAQALAEEVLRNFYSFF